MDKKFGMHGIKGTKEMSGISGKSHNSEIHKAMYGHTGKMKSYKDGGSTEGPESNMSDNMPRYKDGGEMDEKRRGGPMKKKKLCRATGGDIPEIKDGAMAQKKGGRSCSKRAGGGEMMEEKSGEKPEKEKELRKGGRAKGRQHHDFGDIVKSALHMAPLFASFLKEGGRADGGPMPQGDERKNLK